MEAWAVPDPFDALRDLVELGEGVDLEADRLTAGFVEQNADLRAEAEPVVGRLAVIGAAEFDRD